MRLRHRPDDADLTRHGEPDGWQVRQVHPV
jgi:hypothetical protein